MSVASYEINWVSESFIDHVLAGIHPMWSLKKAKAQVLCINTLPDNMVEIRLKPNWHFKRKKAKAGQFVVLSVEIDGIFHQRAYSLVSQASNFELIIAAKVQGKVSNFLANQLKVGEVIEISQPQGTFTLNAAAKDKPLLFIAAGSGITPMCSLVFEALETRALPVTLLYFSRDPAYLEVFERMTHMYPQFHLHVVVDSARNPAHFDESTLANIGVNPSAVHTFLCGAPSLMHAVQTLWQEKGISDQLTQERFVSARSPAPESTDHKFEVRFRQKQKAFLAQGSLLTSAENAGLSPSFGCRMGICNTCTCVKVSGSVKNQLTGRISHAPNESIKLCVSEALSPLEIDA